jgi:hypothetical protein
VRGQPRAGDGSGTTGYLDANNADLEFWSSSEDRRTPELEDSGLKQQDVDENVAVIGDVESSLRIVARVDADRSGVEGLFETPICSSGATRGCVQEKDFSHRASSRIRVKWSWRVCGEQRRSGSSGRTSIGEGAVLRMSIRNPSSHLTCPLRVLLQEMDTRLCIAARDGYTPW